MNNYSDKFFFFDQFPLGTIDSLTVGTRSRTIVGRMPLVCKHKDIAFVGNSGFFLKASPGG